MHVPAMFAVAPGDSLVSVHEMSAIYQKCSSDHKRLAVLPSGAGHGWDMLQTISPPTRWTALATRVATWITGDALR
jgi:hypothetical protein